MMEFVFGMVMSLEQTRDNSKVMKSVYNCPSTHGFRFFLFVLLLYAVLSYVQDVIYFYFLFGPIFKFRSQICCFVVSVIFCVLFIFGFILLTFQHFLSSLSIFFSLISFCFSLLLDLLLFSRFVSYLYFCISKGFCSPNCTSCCCVLWTF